MSPTSSFFPTSTIDSTLKQPGHDQNHSLFKQHMNLDDDLDLHDKINSKNTKYDNVNN